MTAQTTTQRTAKHRLAVKESMAAMTASIERFDVAYCEAVETANKQHREGIISYAELKAAVNTAGWLRCAVHGEDL